MLTYEEVLELLSWRARRGSVSAMVALMKAVERARASAGDVEPDPRFASLDVEPVDRHG
jgi:hypothetical protein